MELFSKIALFQSISPYTNSEGRIIIAHSLRGSKYSNDPGIIIK